MGIYGRRRQRDKVALKSGKKKVNDTMGCTRALLEHPGSLCWEQALAASRFRGGFGLGQLWLPTRALGVPVDIPGRWWGQASGHPVPPGWEGLVSVVRGTSMWCVAMSQRCHRGHRDTTGLALQPVGNL